VKGDEEVRARLESQRRRRTTRANGGLERGQRVDHRVADKVGSLGRRALRSKVVLSLGRVGEKELGEVVDDDAVDLLGHLAVEAPKTGLDVSHRYLRTHRA
jgi:hypothetical protein